MICPECQGSRYTDAEQTKLCRKCRGRAHVSDRPINALLGEWMRAVRPWQEHVLRLAVTAVWVWALWSFCAGLGEDSPSTSVGLFFAWLVTMIPAAWLWSREFSEVRIRHERRNNAQGTQRWVGTAPSPDPARDPINQGEAWRPDQNRGRPMDTYRYDTSDSDDSDDD